MKTWLVARSAVGMTIMMSAGGALAQAAWTPGSEIAGQSVQVTTNGVTNTVYLDQGGAARVVSPGGNTVPGTWTAANGQLCLSVGGGQECWPYASPFQAGQPVTLTSSCNSTSTWLASSTNGPPPRGERGK